MGQIPSVTDPTTGSVSNTDEIEAHGSIQRSDSERHGSTEPERYQLAADDSLLHPPGSFSTVLGAPPPSRGTAVLKNPLLSLETHSKMTDVSSNGSSTIALGNQSAQSTPINNNVDATTWSSAEEASESMYHTLTPADMTSLWKIFNNASKHTEYELYIALKRLNLCVITTTSLVIFSSLSPIQSLINNPSRISLSPLAEQVFDRLSQFRFSGYETTKEYERARRILERAAKAKGENNTRVNKCGESELSDRFAEEDADGPQTAVESSLGSSDDTSSEIRPFVDCVSHQPSLKAHEPDHDLSWNSVQEGKNSAHSGSEPFNHKSSVEAERRDSENRIDPGWPKITEEVEEGLGKYLHFEYSTDHAATESSDIGAGDIVPQLGSTDIPLSNTGSRSAVSSDSLERGRHQYHPPSSDPERSRSDDNSGCPRSLWSQELQYSGQEDPAFQTTKCQVNGENTVQATVSSHETDRHVRPDPTKVDNHPVQGPKHAPSPHERKKLIPRPPRSTFSPARSQHQPLPDLTVVSADQIKAEVRYEDDQSSGADTIKSVNPPLPLGTPGVAAAGNDATPATLDPLIPWQQTATVDQERVIEKYKADVWKLEQELAHGKATLDEYEKEMEYHYKEFRKDCTEELEKMEAEHLKEMDDKVCEVIKHYGTEISEREEKYMADISEIRERQKTQTAKTMKRHKTEMDAQRSFYETRLEESNRKSLQHDKLLVKHDELLHRVKALELDNNHLTQIRATIQKEVQDLKAQVDQLKYFELAYNQVNSEWDALQIEYNEVEVERDDLKCQVEALEAAAQLASESAAAAPAPIVLPPTAIIGKDDIPRLQMIKQQWQVRVDEKWKSVQEKEDQLAKYDREIAALEAQVKKAAATPKASAPKKGKGRKARGKVTESSRDAARDPLPAATSSQTAVQRDPTPAEAHGAQPSLNAKGKTWSAVAAMAPERGRGGGRRG